MSWSPGLPSCCHCWSSEASCFWVRRITRDPLKTATAGVVRIISEAVEMWKLWKTSDGAVFHGPGLEHLGSVNRSAVMAGAFKGSGHPFMGFG